MIEIALEAYLRGSTFAKGEAAMLRFRFSYLISAFLVFSLFLFGTMSTVPRVYASSHPHRPIKIYGSRTGPFTTYNYVGSIKSNCDPGWESGDDAEGYFENDAMTMTGSPGCAIVKWDFGGTQYFYCSIQIWVPSSKADEPNWGFGLYTGGTRIAVVHINEENYTDQWATIPGSNNYGPVTSVSAANNTQDNGYFVGIGATNSSFHIVC
jgi:hypothetical protein